MIRRSRSSPPEDIVPDAELWEAIKQAVMPLRSTGVRATSASPKVVPGKTRSPVPRPSTHSQSPLPQPPHLTGLDRRTAQRLLRGQLRYEAKLDLHGLSAGEARSELAQFLKASRASGRRLVLVVTGKGASPYARHTLHGGTHFHVPERGGRLRRLVVDWLNEPAFRELVSGFQPAHPKHGGGGAFYLKLRRSLKARQ